MRKSALFQHRERMKRDLLTFLINNVKMPFMKNLIALFSSAMFFFHPSAFAVVAVQGPNAQVSVVYADQNKIIARECADETVFNSSGATLSSILKTCAADDEAVIPVARFEADLINNYLSQAKMHGISAQNYNDDQAERLHRARR
jgi:hypothetical protein